MQALTTIKRRDENGETKIPLKMTEEEFEQVVAEYTTGKRFEQKSTSYFERLKEAQAASRTGEELREENFNSVDTEGFEKAVVLLKHWTEMAMQALKESKKVRIVIDYNAEMLKTDFSVYTEIKSNELNDN